VDDLDAKILVILDKSSFESARSISETLHVAHSTMLLHSHGTVNFRFFHLRQVPRLLTHGLRDTRKEYAKAILLFLHAAERNRWHHLVISDES
jgi:hypothetical protein